MSFLPSTPTLLGFTLAGFVLAITPGPDMMLILSRTISGGRRNGFIAMAGITTGLLLHALFAAFGLSALLAASATAFTMLKIAGAAYLLWLAVQAIRHGSAITNISADAAPESASATFWTGFGVNLTNPKVVMFFLTFLPQFVDASHPAASGQLLFLGLFFLVIGIPVASFIILVADRFVTTIRAQPGFARAFDWVFAGVMSAFAVRLLLRSGDAP